MKHLSVRPAAAKLMISCEAFVAAAVLGVVLFLNFYHSYNTLQRTSQSDEGGHNSVI